MNHKKPVSGDTRLKPRKIPKQRRSIALVEALHTTCLSILRNEGADALTISRLAEDSGVAITSIYEYFPTIEAVVGAVLQQVRLQLIDDSLGATDMPLRSARPSSLFDYLLSSVQRSARIRQTLAELHAEIYKRHIAEFDFPSPLLIDSEADFERATTRFSQQLQYYRDEISLADINEAAFLCIRLLQAATRTAILERQDNLADPDFAERIAWGLHQILTYSAAPNRSARH